MDTGRYGQNKQQGGQHDHRQIHFAAGPVQNRQRQQCAVDREPKYHERKTQVLQSDPAKDEHHQNGDADKLPKRIATFLIDRSSIDRRPTYVNLGL